MKTLIRQERCSIADNKEYLWIEVLSVDSVRARLAEVAELIDQEQISGNLRQEDGDESTWETSFEEVEF